MSGAPSATALGFSVQVDFGAGRAGVLQTALPNDCSQLELNQMLVKLNAAGDFCRAHYKIEEEEREVQTLVKMQDDRDADMVRGEENFLKEMAALQTEIDRQQKTLDTFLDAARNAHVESGRRGEFIPKGAQRSQHNAVEGGVKNLQEQMTQKQAERELAIARHAETARGHKKLIQKHEAEIARCKQVVLKGLAANTA